LAQASPYCGEVVFCCAQSVDEDVAFLDCGVTFGDHPGVGLSKSVDLGLKPVHGFADELCT
jgi:hypothetical protein